MELASYSLGKNLKESEYWIALKFLLRGNLSSESEKSLNQENLIGNLTLILDANFKFVDENWSIDVNSPFITAKLGKEELEAN